MFPFLQKRLFSTQRREFELKPGSRGSTSHYRATPETLVPTDLRTGRVEDPYPLAQ